MAKDFSKTGFLVFIILLAVFLSYAPSLKNGFVNWDDDTHLLKNDSVHTLNKENLGQIWTATVNKTYIPLTSLSFALEYHFFGENPFVYHFDNLLLHLLVVFLIFVFSRQCGL